VKVSVIIPVGPDDRSHLLPLALDSYVSQTWPERELIVIDDSPVSHEALVRRCVPDAVYRHIDPATIGAKRNMACEAATGDVIVHFDSDDWSAPDRIEHQVNGLLTTGVSLFGYCAAFFWCKRTGKAYRYIGPPNYSIGAAMCYRRTFWQANPFPDVSNAEDNHVVFIARNAGVIAASDGFQRIVCRVHDTNVTRSGERVGNNNWPEVPADWLPASFFEAEQRCSN